MEIKPNRFGLYKKEDILKTGFPIYDFTKDESPGINTLDHWTYSQLKEIGITITDVERKTLIVGFVRTSGMRGYAPLYSLKQIRELKNL